MNIDQQLVDLTLGVWKSDIGRATKFFSDISDEELLREICPGRNRLIYLLGHLTAVNDALFPLLRFRRAALPGDARGIHNEPGSFAGSRRLFRRRPEA